jgi:lipoprotein-anchoring transpeptidase ErfK/SrfK
MSARLPLIAAVLVGLLLAGAGAVYGYDRSRADLIADGVRVGGIDVGGLTPAQARAKLRRAVLEPLNRPVRVRAVGHRFRLTPAQARIAVDLDGSVSAALGRSREGNAIGRTVRALSGKRLTADVPLDVNYSHRAVRRLVKRVGAAVDRDAVDAAVDLEHGSVTPTPEHAGRELRARRLARAVRRQLLNTGARTVVRARTRVVEPKVTVADLQKKYPAVIIVNRSAFQLTLYRNLQPVRTYGIAVGQVGLETPAGLYNIENKAVNPDWHVPNSAWAGDLAGTVVSGTDPSNPIKARWMGIYAGAGIHGTDAIDSIGTAASHGCIRMTIPDVEELYDQVPVGAPVYIS